MTHFTEVNRSVENLALSSDQYDKRPSNMLLISLISGGALQKLAWQVLAFKMWLFLSLLLCTFCQTEIDPKEVAPPYILKITGTQSGGSNFAVEVDRYPYEFSGSGSSYSLLVYPTTTGQFTVSLYRQYFGIAGGCSSTKTGFSRGILSFTLSSTSWSMSASGRDKKDDSLSCTSLSGNYGSTVVNGQCSNSDGSLYYSINVIEGTHTTNQVREISVKGSRSSSPFAFGALTTLSSYEQRFFSNSGSSFDYSILIDSVSSYNLYLFGEITGLGSAFCAQTETGVEEARISFTSMGVNSYSFSDLRMT
eukprot:Pompholyxophrys_punicea_v1_NODE_276_length_2409_cov_3.346644.p1 type:complete len:307 gc:universal NODE_276_length_2409_cov_3.346644:973-53(-)